MGLRSLYNWVVKQAGRPHAPYLLFFMAMIEPCVLPLPPDILLIPMAIARRDRAYRLALVGTAGSCLGALFGYAIGAWAMHTIGVVIVQTYHLEAGFEHFHHAFQRWGMWIILAKGLTPIPFILVTIASGVAGLPIPIFIISCIITRGARFFFEAWLIHRYGAPIQTFIEKHLPWIALAVLLAIVGGFWFVLR